MKLAFLLRYWPFYGGGETVTRVLTEEFLKRGHEVHIIYWWDSSEGRSFAPTGLYFEHKIDVPLIGKYDAGGDASKIKVECENYITCKDIQVVINQWWPAEISPIGKNFKCIKCWHTMVLPSENNSTFLRRIYHRFYRNQRYKNHVSCLLDPFYNISDKLIFLAKVYESEFKKYSMSYTESNRLGYIHNPLTYLEVPDITYDNKKKDVIFVGRIEEPVKKITRIIDAWSIIQKAGYNDWNLKIIGDGPDLQMLKNYAVIHGVINISFLGAKDPREDYTLAKILLITSEMEGWPMTIIEGKAFGVVPIVTNTFSAATEVVNHLDDGFVVNESSPMKIADAMIQLMDSPSELKRFSNNAVMNSKLYTITNIANEWETMLKKMLNI